MVVFAKMELFFQSPKENKMGRFDESFYMGWFRWKETCMLKCRQCQEPADGFCLILGKGKIIPLILCEDCGLEADKFFSNPNRRRTMREEDCKYIASIEGPAETVAKRFDVDFKQVRRFRKKYAKTISKPL